jgi:hypothetical protein
MNIIGLNATQVRTATESPEFQVGTVGRDDFSGYLYKYVKYNAGAGSVASAAGNFVFNYAPSGASAGAFTEVTSDVTDSGGIGMGVLQAVIANGGYGWIQITGYAVLTTALKAGADGNALTAVGSDDGTLDVSAAVTDFICATAIDADAKKVFLTCPL